MEKHVRLLPRPFNLYKKGARMTEKNIVQLNKPPVEDQARLKCYSEYTPIKDVEVVDAKQKIFKGKRIVEPRTNPDEMLIIYFRRPDTKDPAKLTEIERMWPEVHIHDCSIMGFEFDLIPKVRLLFGYDPPSSSIIKAPMRMKERGPFDR